MAFWPAWRRSADFKSAFQSKEEADYWKKCFDITYAGKIDTWDYQWTAVIRKAHGLNVIPKVNLVTNIGFGSDATHTKNINTRLSLPAEALSCNDKMPEKIYVNTEADKHVFSEVFLMKQDMSTVKTNYQTLAKRCSSLFVLNFGLGKGALILFKCLVATPLYQKAFLPLARMKAAGKKWKGIDYLRGKIRLKSGFPMEAAEMLKEELRLHPAHSKARHLLNKIMADAPIYRSEKHNELSCLFAELRPYTMLSPDRLLALYKGAKNICEKDIPGNFVECGVAAGGSSALLAWVIKRYSRRSRLLYSFDTFTGMPKSGVYDTHAGIDAQSTGWGEGTCAAPIESVLEIAGKLDVESIVNPVQGLFQDTLPKTKDKIGPVALLHLDGDWYDSTRTILENLYSQVEIGAYLQVDDYGHWEGCRKAFDEFFKKIRHRPATKPIDATGVWFEKSV